MTTEIDGLAKLIVGDVQRPDWLDAALVRAVAALRYGISAGAQAPGRAELRKRLFDMREAAQSIAAALDDGAVMRALAALAPVDDETERQTFRALMDLIERTDAALPGIAPGPGRNTFDPNRSPHEICSMLVCTLWRMVRGAAPGHAAKVPNDACNTLWRLAGGKEFPGETNETRRWLRQIKATNEAIEAHGCEDTLRVLGCTERSV